MKKKKPTSNKLYNIDVEFPRAKGYVFLRFFEEVSEDKAIVACGKMKAAGIGGRLLHLDGTPDGRVVEQWSSVERIAEIREEVLKH